MTKSRRQRSRIATRKKYSFELVTELLQCRWSRHQLQQQSSVVWITGNTSGYAEYSIILAANHLQQSYGINDVMLHKKVSEAHAISPRCHHRPLAWPVQQRSGHQHYCAAGPVTPVPDKYAFQVTDKETNGKTVPTCKAHLTSSVAAGFGRHGMPPPVCNCDLWPFDLETDVQVTSKVGNLHYKFGHARPLSSWIFAM